MYFVLLSDLSKSDRVPFTTKSLAFLQLCHLLEHRIDTLHDLEVQNSLCFRKMEHSIHQIFSINLVLKYLSV